MHLCKQAEADAWVGNQKEEPETRRRWEIIYEVTHGRYSQSRIHSQSVSLAVSSQKRFGYSRGSMSAQQGAVPLPSEEAEEMLSGALSMETQYG